MKFDKFTLKAQEALATAQQIAMAKSNTVLSSLHLLSAMLSDDDGIVNMILKRIGSNISRIKEITDSEIDRLATGSASAQLLPEPALNQIVLDAQNRADGGPKLTELQIRAAELMCRGEFTRTQIAEQLNMSPRQLRRWFNESEAFQQHIDTLIAECVERSRRLFSQYAAPVAQRLIDVARGKVKGSATSIKAGIFILQQVQGAPNPQAPVQINLPGVSDEDMQKLADMHGGPTEGDVAAFKLVPGDEIEKVSCQASG